MTKRGDLFSRKKRVSNQVALLQRKSSGESSLNKPDSVQVGAWEAAAERVGKQAEASKTLWEEVTLFDIKLIHTHTAVYICV